MKRILLISRCPPYPLHFGDRLIIWHLARELSQRGYKLDLLALTQYESDQMERAYYAPFFESVTLFPERRRTPLMYLRRLFGRRYPQHQGEIWQPDLWQAIQESMQTHRYDLVHLFGGIHVYEYAALVENTATVITPYESYSLYLQRAYRANPRPELWLSHKVAQLFERWMFNHYDRTVVLSEEDRQALLQLNSHLAVEVIPNGIDLDHFKQQSIPRDPATLLFVGNYAYEPNHTAALLLARDIFPQVQRAIPDAKLLLVGNAPTEEMRLLENEHITITGRVEQVQDYLARATVFVCPLTIGAGIKNKVLEALAMGIPTIATPLSMEGIAAEDGVHALISDVENMAEDTRKLIQDKALQSQLAANGRRLIEARYSWKTVAEQYERIYDIVTSDG